MENGTYTAGRIAFKPASCAATGVPTTGGSMKGIVTRFERRVATSVVRTQMIMPIVIPVKGRPPSWKGI